MEKAIRRYWPIFVLPTFLAFILGFIAPFAMGVYLSFCKFTTVTDAKFIGFSNYLKIFTDASFVHALWYTAIFTVVTVVLINVLAFAVALLLTKGFRGTNIFRTVFFMPNLIGGIILGYIWQLLLNGVLLYMNRTLTYSSVYGFWGLVILMCWQQIGYMMIIYIAGIQNIPGDLIEAAKIDGATSGQILKNVTIPMVMPSITICTFLTLTNSFKLFDQNLALTNGEPSNMSELLALNIFRTFYGRTGWEGVGQAKAVVFFLLVALAAMTSSISLMETVVSIVEERFHWKRTPSCLIVTGVSFLIGLLSVFGYSIWSDFTIFHMQMLDFFDYISNNIMMPIVALMTCILVGFVVKTTYVENEIEKNERFRSKGLYRIMIKFICPICMLLILFSSLFLTL